VHKSMRPDEMHPRVPRELMDEVPNHTLSYLRSCGSLGRSPSTGEGATSPPFLKKDKKEDPGKYRPVSLISVPGKMTEQILLETMLRHMDNKKVIGDSQHDFTKGKSCLTNSAAFYDRVTAFVDKGRATDIIYLDLCKAFNAVLHDVLLSKL